MKKIYILLLAVALYFMFLANCLSQSLSVFDIDTSAFPTIKAKFLAFDQNDSLIKNLSASDFQVLENGVQRTVTSVSCPTSTSVPISSVLMMDVSQSMCNNGGIDIAKAAASVWVNMLPLDSSECAIGSFSDDSYINQDFTTSKTKLQTAINNLSCIKGSNNDTTMFNNPASGLSIAEAGKYKRIIVFLIDGSPILEPKTSQIINEAIANNITIYCITIGSWAPQFMKDFTSKTDGMCFERINSTEEAEKCYRKILLNVTGVSPCTLEWQSNYQCSSPNVSTLINLFQNNSKDSFIYIVSHSAIAIIKVVPIGVYFKNISPGTIQDTTITIIAVNSPYLVTDIISSNPLFSITPTSFSLNAGDSLILTVTYAPTDSSNQFSRFNFISNQCPDSFSVEGYYDYKKTTQQILKLTHPNGGEILLEGSDIVISWEGVLPDDIVKLEYSLDSGSTWIVLTTEATGLSWVWKDIPKITSNKCLIRATTKIAPNIEWQKCLGGRYSDFGYSIEETSEGGYIVAGETESNDGDVTGNHGNSSDFWIVKLKINGDIEWQKCLGGSEIESTCSIHQTKDSGYIIAGMASSVDGDVTGRHGDTTNFDCWIVKLKSTGFIEWQKCIGGSNRDVTNAIIETNDGGYIFVGGTSSNDYDITGNHGNTDCLVVKLKNNGNIEWQKCFGGSKDDYGTSIQKTDDGGYIIAGVTSSNDGDINGNHGGYYDSWIIKLTSQGDIEWQKCFGGSGLDIAGSIQRTSVGGYIVAGYSNSNDGDVNGNHGGTDLWVFKLTNTGDIEWQNCFGGVNNDYGGSIQETYDGGFIVAGQINGPMLGDASILKLTKDGLLEWQKCLGGSNNDAATCIQETFNEGFIIVGSTSSSDKDVKGYHGNTDCWVVKLTPEGNIQQDVSDSVFSIVVPQVTSKDIDLGYCLIGYEIDSLVTSFLTNTGNCKCRIDSIYFTGADSSAFGLTAGFQPFEIAVGDSSNIEFFFKPLRWGVHKAQIVVITQADTLISKITGFGYLPSIAISSDFIDFGKVKIGDVKDSLHAITIKNINSIPLTILKIKCDKPNDVDFSILSDIGAITLQPGDTYNVSLMFKPSDVGRTSGTLEFYYDGVGSPAVIQLYGERIAPIVGTATVQIPILEGYPGDTITIPIYLKNSQNVIQSGTTGFKADLNFNVSLLVPIEEPLGNVNNNIRTIPLDLPAIADSNDILIKLKFIATLGMDTTTALSLSNFLPIGGQTTISVIDGLFRLLGVCHEGGARLINTDGTISLTCKPNPAGDKVQFDFTTIEDGYTELYITDMLGNKLMKVFESDTHGKYSIEAVLSLLYNGVYAYTLQTPTARMSKLFLIDN